MSRLAQRWRRRPRIPADLTASRIMAAKVVLGGRLDPGGIRPHALAMLDHLLVQDPFLTETAFHADVVLPASAFAEMAATTRSFNNITWVRLEREGAVTYPVDAPDVPGNDIISTNGLPTAHGRDDPACRRAR